MGQKYAGPGLDGHTISFYDEEITPVDQLPAGCVSISDEDWIRANREQGWSVVDGVIIPRPQDTPEQQQAKRRAMTVQDAQRQGLTIVCPTVDGLNGVYAIDDVVIGKINAVETYVDKRKKFPGTPGDTLSWPDLTGALHVFPTVELFTTFSGLILDYAADVSDYAAGTRADLPPATAKLI